VILNLVLPFEADERLNIVVEDADVESGAADISKNQRGGSIEESGDEKEHELLEKRHESGASSGTTTAVREVV